MIDDLPPKTNVKAILSALEKGGVDFVVIGGLAGIAHGSAYPTFDVDVAYSRSKQNIERLLGVLKDLGVRLRGVPPDLPFRLDQRSLENGMNFTFVCSLGAVDVLGEPAGIKSYDELKAGASTERIEGVDVRLASVDHLIAMKKAANRPKDRLVLEELLVISDEEAREAAEDA